MSFQSPDDVRKEQVLSVLLNADANLVNRLMQIDLPNVPIRSLRASCNDGFRGIDKILTQLGYQEETEKRQTKVPWRLFGRCQGCKVAILSGTQNAFSCGHIRCNSCHVSCCLKCGPLFTRDLDLTAPTIPRIDWPDASVVATGKPSVAQLERFGDLVLQRHKNAFQAVPVEALVSCALDGSTSQIAPFIGSHYDLMGVVKSAANHPALYHAWVYALRAAKGVGLLEVALLTGLHSWSADLGRLFDQHTLEPIRVMYDTYTIRDFLRRLPLLSKRLIRSGMLDTNFWVFNALELGHDLKAIQKEDWVIQSYHAMKRAVEAPGDEAQLLQWRNKLVEDVADICSEYPMAVHTFHCLVKDLQELRDYLTCGAITDGMVPIIGRETADRYLEQLRLEMGSHTPCIPLMEGNDFQGYFDGFDLERRMGCRLPRLAKLGGGVNGSFLGPRVGKSYGANSYQSSYAIDFVNICHLPILKHMRTLVSNLGCVTTDRSGRGVPYDDQRLASVGMQARRQTRSAIIKSLDSYPAGPAVS